MTPERLTELRARYPSLAAVGELAAEIEHLWTAVTIFQDQRDGALATIRAHAEPLRRLAGLRLETSPGDDGWGLVQYMALHLLRFAGPPLPPEARTGRRPVGTVEWAIGLGPIGSPDFHVIGDYTEAGARHHAPEYDEGHAVYRHLGPWLDAPDAEKSRT